MSHLESLQVAAADGQLWNLRYASVPEPHETATYIENALRSQAQGQRLPFAVIDAGTDCLVGTTSYYDMVPSIGRLEIGWTWYARRVQRTHINTAAKLLLMSHAFETLGASVIAWRTDNFNVASQRAIERLGAKRDGVIRHHQLRRDGTVRDTVMYSMTAGEWPEARAHLQWLLTRPRV
jgi:RimJ/RimL family protein N-acetyltransferase